MSASIGAATADTPKRLGAQLIPTDSVLFKVEQIDLFGATYAAGVRSGDNIHEMRFEQSGAVCKTVQCVRNELQRLSDVVTIVYSHDGNKSKKYTVSVWPKAQGGATRIQSSTRSDHTRSYYDETPTGPPALLPTPSVGPWFKQFQTALGVELRWAQYPIDHLGKDRVNAVVVTRIDPASRLYKEGVRIGNMITQVDGHELTTLPFADRDLEDRLKRNIVSITFSRNYHKYNMVTVNNLSPVDRTVNFAQDKQLFSAVQQAQGYKPPAASEDMLFFTSSIRPTPRLSRAIQGGANSMAAFCSIVKSEADANPVANARGSLHRVFQFHSNEPRLIELFGYNPFESLSSMWSWFGESSYCQPTRFTLSYAFDNSNLGSCASLQASVDNRLASSNVPLFNGREGFNSPSIGRSASGLIRIDENSATKADELFQLPEVAATWRGAMGVSSSGRPFFGQVEMTIVDGQIEAYSINQLALMSNAMPHEIDRHIQRYADHQSERYASIAQHFGIETKRNPVSVSSVLNESSFAASKYGKCSLGIKWIQQDYRQTPEQVHPAMSTSYEQIRTKLDALDRQREAKLRADESACRDREDYDACSRSCFAGRAGTCEIHHRLRRIRIEQRMTDRDRYLIRNPECANDSNWWIEGEPARKPFWCEY